MFQTHSISDDQSYLVVDYDTFSLTVGVLNFHKRKPRLVECVRSFFGAHERTFHPRTFERNLMQSCEQLQKKVGTLPKEICLFLDHGQSVITSTGYTFTRSDTSGPLALHEIYDYCDRLIQQSDHQAGKLWHEEYGYPEYTRKLFSVFLSQLALDKRHHSYPLGKIASQVSLRCLFFYGNKVLLESITRSIEACDFQLLTCVPLPIVFLNHLCNQKTFLENHLHIHLGYDTTTVVLHLGKHIQEIQSIPLGWQILDEKLAKTLSPLERESLIFGEYSQSFGSREECQEYLEFLSVTLRALFEKFSLQWSFHDYTVSGQGPVELIRSCVSEGTLSPWIQKNALCRRIGADPDEHWLHYCETLDPLFALNPNPLLSLIRSVFTSPHAHN